MGFLAQAQVSLGIKGGMSSSNIDIKDPQGSFQKFKEGGDIKGYHAGIFVRANVLGFMLQPEVLLSKSGGEIKYDDTQQGTIVEKLGFTHLDVPLLVGYKLAFFRAYGGPVASVLLDGDIGDDKIDQYLENSEWGYQVGGGIDISRFTADVRYESLKRSYNDANAGSADIKNNQVIVSLGYKLFGK
ncbi:hypothetical protein TH63_09005 [Rufibacter radiotolerans]|uniref:Outer membrane protein beta-barrel domain-containing protein n=2 Tax=Rufibacter radiotolerans TaxID=1379910 RepID=A0A0H4VIW8_9BACT|nr:hypothetical protein TH63_09005 [Rufibacter radiotolerans]